ncbi:hypothetical protein K504DRAFT_412034 [Pleomassaria siparia CBS 279.74]|uniref:Methyltransferase domain-containing protein n=1 Tax=Pleomassaria siparia CBS 279.74 TaxID=1314801 RepID=A0A6G1K2N5_9PLEO|nr:hypothetical protein K504DRAFT_412034 [Pleomassaria siparia CBS 279.74]
MPVQPPSFGLQQYWDDRFKSNANPFEWLEAPTSLDPFLVDALNQTNDQSPEILHIGCGTSLLSYHLRAHVNHPEQIHNLDYSEVAIDIGRRREADIFNEEIVGAEEGMKDVVDTKTGTMMETDGTKEPGKPRSQSTSAQDSGRPFMRWSSANLLSHVSLLNNCNPSTYSIIVDKSTTDSIACADDIDVPLPYPIGTSLDASLQITQSTEPVHPVRILAINLAVIAKPKARWIALSYSQERFPFLDGDSSRKTSSNSFSNSVFAELTGFDKESDNNFDHVPLEGIERGLPDPSTLWTLIGKHEIEVPQRVSKNGAFTTNTHMPKVFHWIYVLERTDVEVFVRDN